MSISEAIRNMHAAAAMGVNSISEDDRREALKACEALRVSLENPMEMGIRILFSVLLLAFLSPLRLPSPRQHLSINDAFSLTKRLPFGWALTWVFSMPQPGYLGTEAEA